VKICANCPHNITHHRMEWDRFRGVWNRSCMAEVWGVVPETCRCNGFQERAA